MLAFILRVAKRAVEHPMRIVLCRTNNWMARLDLPRSSNCGGAATAGS